MNSSQKTTIRRALGVFSIAMITAGSVDSIRNLPLTALFGDSLIFFFLTAAILFLLPCALVSAELASNSKDHGGIYVWVKNAFGMRTGFLAIWFQWIENVIWYPAILAFVAGTIGYLVSPTLANNKAFLITIILCSFWGTTLINLFGIKSSARFANLCALFGLILPMTLIISLGVVWVLAGNPIQIHFNSMHSLIPHFHNSHMWVALTGIILSFGGVEIATVHAGDVRDAQRTYPRAMLIATLIIMVTLLSGGLSIAIVLPAKNISLVAGIMQAFHAFFSAYHLDWILPAIAVMLVIGAMGSVNNWVIAPTRGLFIAAKDGNMPRYLQTENRFGAPKALLIYQALIVSVVTMVFLLMPSVNGSYWLLTALAAQLYMMMYVLMFATAIKLRLSGQYSANGFRIPFGKIGIVLVSGIGLLSSILTFVIGFIPPDNVNVGGVQHYEILLVIGLLAMSIPPFVFYQIGHRKRNAAKVDVLKEESEEIYQS